MPSPGAEMNAEGGLIRLTPDLNSPVNSEENETVWQAVYAAVKDVVEKASQSPYIQNELTELLAHRSQLK